MHRLPVLTGSIGGWLQYGLEKAHEKLLRAVRQLVQRDSNIRP